MRLALSAIPAVLFVTCCTASAQTVVWSDSFESGFADWHSTIDGICGAWVVGGETCVGAWSALDGSNACAAWALPFADGANVAWFGLLGTCTYNGGSETASNHALVKNTPIALPSGAGSLALRFFSKSQTENDPSYDVRSVRLSADGGANWTTLGTVQDSDWYEASFDVSSWSGQSVLLKFKFETFDDNANAFHGWYVDGVRIESSPDTGTRFCAGDGSAADCPCGNFGASGHGCATSFDPNGASLTASGSPQVSSDSVVLAVSGVSNSVVTFFQGTAQQASGLGTVFGDGLRCSSGNVIRLRAVLAAGNAARFPNAGEPAVSIAGALPGTGGMRTYQVWYRNAASFCTISTFNLSNGLILTWMP